MSTADAFPMAQSPAFTARKLFATNLRRFRRLAGLTQEALAERAGVHPNYLGSVERGERNISIDNMERLAAALGTDLASFLEGDSPCK